MSHGLVQAPEHTLGQQAHVMGSCPAALAHVGNLWLVPCAAACPWSVVWCLLSPAVPADVDALPQQEAAARAGAGAAAALGHPPT